MVMSMMKIIGDWHDKLYAWAFSGDDDSMIKATAKAFVAGFIDGWNLYCLMFGNVVLIFGVIMSIRQKFFGKK